MKQMKWILPSLLWIAVSSVAPAQTDQQDRCVAEAQAATIAPPPHAELIDAPLSAQKEKIALRILLYSLQSHVASAADAMPADKYGFAPTDGEFKGVRSFGQQVKHLAATNHILAAAALGEEPPIDAGDETGPETVRTKAEILDYLKSSFAHLSRAVDAIGDARVPVRPSPISPLSATTVTRLSLVVESLVHTYDHYGQMVEYLRMNGVVPPASRP